MEQANGHFANNLVTVLMHDNNIDLQAAFDLVGKKYAHLVEQFQSARLQMPSFSNEVDEMVSKYMEGLTYCISGNLKFVAPLFFLTSQ